MSKYSLKEMEKIFEDKNKDLREFNYLFSDNSKYKVNKILPKRINSTVSFIQFPGESEELVLKEMDEPREVGEINIDISPRISKLLSSKYGKQYPNNLLKYYGEETLTKNLSKKLDGDFSECAGRKNADCEINGYILPSGKLRVKQLAKEYENLIESLNKLHEMGIAHRDIKFDNIFRDGEKFYIADYDKVCRNSKFTDKRYFDLIPPCDQKGARLPVSYIPPEFINNDHYYLNDFDFYQLAITFYEIIVNKPYITRNEFDNLVKVMNQNPNSSSQIMKDYFNKKYEILEFEMNQLMNQLDNNQEKSLIMFILKHADPNYEYSKSLKQPIETVQSKTKGNKIKNIEQQEKCDRNSKILNTNCYQTKSKVTGLDTIVPSYCDRILFNYETNKLISSVIPVDYNSLYLEDSKYDSDHNLVYSRITIDFEKEYGLAFLDKLDSKRKRFQPYLNLIYVTLNQGEGIGDGANTEHLRVLYELFQDQDLIIIGLQEIQPKSKLEYIMSQKTIPFIQTIEKDLKKDYKLFYSKIYGMAKRRTGLFVFVKNFDNIIGLDIPKPVSNNIEKCLVGRPEKICNKSFIGATIKFRIESINKYGYKDLYINMYDTHLSFSQTSKDLAFSKRANQLQKIVGIMIERSKNQENHINILGGDLNFRNSDMNVGPELIITSLAKEVTDKFGAVTEFREPIQGNMYAFPPSCKLKTRKDIQKEQKVKDKQQIIQKQKSPPKQQKQKSSIYPMETQESIQSVYKPITVRTLKSSNLYEPIVLNRNT